MNWKRAYITILMICLGVYSYSQTQADSLDINIFLKDEYIIGDTIDFHYVNISHKKLFVHVSLERADEEGEWQTYFHEIYINHEFREYDNTIFIHIGGHMSLSENSSTAINDCRNDTWIVNNNCLYGNENIAMFRFKYTVTEIPYGMVLKETKVAPKESISYSKPFYVKRDSSIKKTEICKCRNRFVMVEP